MPTRGAYPNRRSIRLRNYDYAQNGAYFVTIVAHQRQNLFGEIVRVDVTLTLLGEIICETWNHIPLHFPFVELDAFVVMPNHVHGIIVIDQPNAFLSDNPSPQTPGSAAQSLPAIVGNFKSVSARKINQHRQTPGEPVWHRNYFERVIRNERELQATRKYIVENPMNWVDDRERGQ